MVLEENIIGVKYNCLTVIRKIKINGKTKWECQCDCGNLTTAKLYALKAGKKKSCGCQKLRASIENGKKNKTHGLCKTRQYRIWRGMLTRCYNKNDKAYHKYGGRGILICEEWKNNFQAFYDWAMDNGYDDKLSLDRIDNNKGYSPGNCRWATAKQQINNTRANHYLEYKGEKHSIAEWSDITGIERTCLSKRINNSKWPIEKALTTTVRRRKNV